MLLGSNLGNRLLWLQKAIDAIEKKIGSIEKKSKIYETEPWGVQNQLPYLNQVLAVKSSLLPGEVLAKILAIEADLGRTRSQRWESRLIDIDILYADRYIHQTTILEIPHPRLAERRFVLVPLAEIAPDFIHPVSQKSNKLLLEECQDACAVVVFSE